MKGDTHLTAAARTALSFDNGSAITDQLSDLCTHVALLNAERVPVTKIVPVSDREVFHVTTGGEVCYLGYFDGYFDDPTLICWVELNGPVPVPAGFDVGRAKPQFSLE